MSEEAQYREAQHTAALEEITALRRELAAERMAREAAQEHRREAAARLKEATDRNLALLARAEQAEDEVKALRISVEWHDKAALDADHPGAAMLERLRALEKAATQASAELRHTFRPETRDWNLVARAIRILEEATIPGAADALRGNA